MNNIKINDKKIDSNNNGTINNNKQVKKKSILSRNKLNFSSMNDVKLEKNKTDNKILKGMKLKPEKKKNKFKLKELINNFSVSNLPKQRELLIPLKINKKNNIKKMKQQMN